MCDVQIVNVVNDVQSFETLSKGYLEEGYKLVTSNIQIIPRPSEYDEYHYQAMFVKQSVKTTNKVTLELSKQAAEWLKEAVKNPINLDRYEIEDRISCVSRKEIWKALNA